MEDLRYGSADEDHMSLSEARLRVDIPHCAVPMAQSQQGCLYICTIPIRCEKHGVQITNYVDGRSVRRQSLDANLWGTGVGVCDRLQC